MKPSKRLDRIPPYAFAELERKIAEKRAAGVDVISLGIGDPDRPTPALVVEAMQEAVTEPETHRYPSNRGREDFRAAVRDFYERRFDVKLDPESEIIPAIGAKEAIFNLNLAFLDPGDYALAADPGYPVYTGGPWLAGGAAGPVALEAAGGVARPSAAGGPWLPVVHGWAVAGGRRAGADGARARARLRARSGRDRRGRGAQDKAD